MRIYYLSFSFNFLQALMICIIQILCLERQISCITFQMSQKSFSLVLRFRIFISDLYIGVMLKHALVSFKNSELILILTKNLFFSFYKTVPHLDMHAVIERILILYNMISFLLFFYIRNKNMKFKVNQKIQFV